jgi:hypothetical protein
MADRKKSSPEEAAAPEFGSMVLPQHLRPSRDLIYEAMMRGGGEAFGAPYDLGVATLTQKIVAKLKQRGFFGFETLEKQPPRWHRNKFTRQGAAQYRGPYRRKPQP